MAESALITSVAVLSGLVGLAVILFAFFSRRRPRLFHGPVAAGVAVATIVAGLLVLLTGAATHGAEILVYTGGIVVLIGVGVITGAIATLPHPEGDEAGH